MSEGHIVGGDDDGAPPVAFNGDEFFHPLHPHRVEAGGGLVEKYQLGFVQEGTGNVEAHTHALAHVCSEQIRVVSEADGGQQPLQLPDGSAI